LFFPDGERKSFSENHRIFVSEKCIPSGSDKNVAIKFSAHDTFLELPSSGTFKIERLECQIT